MTSRMAIRPSSLADCLSQEICCPPNTSCHRSPQTSSRVLCCPHAFSCTNDNRSIAQCPAHAFECPVSVGGGCCPIGLRCASDQCFEYHYKTLAVLQPLPIQNNTSLVPQGFYGCIIPATVGFMQTPAPPSSVSTKRAVQTCTWQDCQPADVDQQSQDLQASNMHLGNSAAWRAKLGEIAVRSEAEENWDVAKGKRRLRRLGCVVMGLLVITVVMFVF